MGVNTGVLGAAGFASEVGVRQYACGVRELSPEPRRVKVVERIRSITAQFELV
jgi:hypothetical protein